MMMVDEGHQMDTDDACTSPQRNRAISVGENNNRRSFFRWAKASVRQNPGKFFIDFLPYFT